MSLALYVLQHRFTNKMLTQIAVLWGVLEWKGPFKERIKVGLRLSTTENFLKRPNARWAYSFVNKSYAGPHHTGYLRNSSALWELGSVVSSAWLLDRNSHLWFFAKVHNAIIAMLALCSQPSTPMKFPQCRAASWTVYCFVCEVAWAHDASLTLL